MQVWTDSGERVKQRAVTVEGIRFEPHWLSGYVGEINGKRVSIEQEGDRDWIVRRNVFYFWRRAIGGGRTMREAVKMAMGRA